MSRVSEHISLKEATRSSTAKRRGISNLPTPSQLENMKMTADMCFEPLRIHHGKPIFVSSMLRTKELNRAVGGSRTSGHLQGAYSLKKEGAIDIDCDVFDNGITNREAFHWLKENVDYDQIIYEYPNKAGEPGWVHIGYRKGANRGHALIAYVNPEGKKTYVAYSDKKLKEICAEMKN